jgi:MoaA/NifB/PqqE/SkfB family radical SAM enzyme
MALLRKKSNDAYLYWADQVLHRLRGEEPDGAPSFAYFEPSTGCNLKCPACVTGTMPEMRTRKQANLDDFVTVLDSLGDKLLRLELYNWGEPFLNKHLPTFVRLASERSIHTALSTNFSFPNMDARIEETLGAGLRTLKVGLDGASQEVHNTYRRGAQLDLVKKNLAHAAATRDKHNYPIRIYAAFLAFEHNVHELQEIYDFCESIGVELEINTNPYTSDHAGIHAAPGISTDVRDVWAGYIGQRGIPSKRCSWLYHSVVINPNLSVSPCCAVADERDDFAQLSKDSLGADIGSILRHQSWRDARGFFEQKTEEEVKDILLNGIKLDPETPGMGNIKGDDFICARCPIGTEAFKYLYEVRRMNADLLNETASVPLADEEDKFDLFFKITICALIDGFSSRPASDTRIAEFEAALVLMRAMIDPRADRRSTAQALLTLISAIGFDPVAQAARLMFRPMTEINLTPRQKGREVRDGVGAQVAQIMAQHHARKAAALRSAS